MSIRQLALAGADGRNWYREARAALPMLGADVDMVAKLLAVTSPRVHVRRSVRVTRDIISGVRPGGLLPNVCTQVDRIISGGEPSGPKVSAFYRALMGDEDAVVVDTWIIKAFGMDATRGVSHKQYHMLASKIKRLSKKLGWTPAETQAAIWCATMSKHGRKPTSMAQVIMEVCNG